MTTDVTNLISGMAALIAETLLTSEVTETDLSGEYSSSLSSDYRCD